MATTMWPTFSRPAIGKTPSDASLILPSSSRDAMPEGHTIHRLARDHSKWFAGKKVLVESPQGRFSEDATRISGKSLKSVEAYGKHLFYNFGGSKILHVHLGLYGRFRVYRTPLPEPCGAVRVRLFGRERGFDLNGPNQCELVSAAEMRRLCEKLGQDPLRRDSDPIALWDRVTRSKKTIANILLDQSMIAGVGNIYRAEILFLLGIDPMRPGNELKKCEFNELWALTKRLMEIVSIEVPKTNLAMPHHRIAPWHMQHGSAVVNSHKSDQFFSCPLAYASIAAISPCNSGFICD